MRLIDADALIEKKWQAESEECFYAMEDVVSVTDIEEAPTIELCEDVISREEVLRTIITCENVDSDLTHLYKVIENAPSVASSRPSGEWIPCSERMPEEREWIGTKKFGTTISDSVLVTFESRGERFVKLIRFQNGELGDMDKRTMDAFHGEWKAVAWMPFPEPWKGEDDGK